MNTEAATNTEVVIRRYVGKVGLVTGGGMGLGKACCLRLASEGAAVAVLDIDDEQGESVAKEIVAAGGKAIYIHTDVTDSAAVAAAVQRTVAELGRLDVAVNNAGMSAACPLLYMPQEFWDKALALNLTSVFHCMQAEMTVMMQQGSGSIVNMASVFGMVGGPNIAAYVATKHGVIGLTKAAALEFGRMNVRVNAVAPTFVRTPLTSVFDDASWAALEALHAMGRLPTPEDIAAMVAFLGSSDAAFVTGGVFPVDAGLTAG